MIEAPAKHISIVSEPVPMPDFDAEETPAEEASAEEKSEDAPKSEE